MKILIKISLVSPTYHYTPGQIVEHDDAEAERLIEAGIAEACPDIIGSALAALVSLELPVDWSCASASERLSRIAGRIAAVKDADERERIAAALLGPLADVFDSPCPVATSTHVAPEAATIGNAQPGRPLVVPSTPESTTSAPEVAAGTPVRRRRGTSQPVATPAPDPEEAD